MTLKTRAISIVALGVLIALVVRTRTAATEEPSHHHGIFAAAPVTEAISVGVPTSQGLGLTVSVDGALTPDAIPTELAEQHFLRAIAIPARSEAADQVRQAAMLDAIGFTKADRDSFVASLAGVGDQLTALASAQGSLAARQDEQAKVRATFDSLRSTLTSQGVQRLDAYLNTVVKSNIKIYTGSTPD